MKIFISPPSQTAWRIVPSSLRQWLDASGCRVTECASASAYLIEWVTASGLVSGYLFRDGQAVVFDGDIDEIVDNAVRFRFEIQDNQELVIYDENYSACVPLNPGAKIEDLAKGLEVLRG